MLFRAMFLTPGIPLKNVRGSLRDRGELGGSDLAPPPPMHPEQRKDFFIFSVRHKATLMYSLCLTQLEGTPLTLKSKLICLVMMKTPQQ